MLTSGGDAPGMNAAIRSVARCGVGRGWGVLGVKDGYEGLMRGAFTELGPRDVGGILQLGGTILGSSRSAQFHRRSGQMKAVAALHRRKVDSLIVIGGGGSQAGAHALSTRGISVIGLASTIDNDLFGAEPALGVDTALNVALEAVDRLKSTASSHRRAFIIEVMGRDCGYLALMTALAGGAEAVVLPEMDASPQDVARQLRDAHRRHKPHGIVVVAEGARYSASALAAYFKRHPQETGFELRVTILGHVQRGARPTAFDRLLGTRLGAAAVDRLAAGERGVVLGTLLGRIHATPLAEAASSKVHLDTTLIELNDRLAI